MSRDLHQEALDLGNGYEVKCLLWLLAEARWWAEIRTMDQMGPPWTLPWRTWDGDDDVAR